MDVCGLGPRSTTGWGRTPELHKQTMEHVGQCASVIKFAILKKDSWSLADTFEYLWAEIWKILKNIEAVLFYLM